MKNIILTGGIASGKSEASKHFQHLGVPIIDSDKIVHTLLSINTPAYQEIIQYFGSSILCPDKKINRSELAKLIFSNLIEKQWLENLLHPLVLNEIITQITDIKKMPTPPVYCIIDIPLYAEMMISTNKLLKNKFKRLADKVLVIDAEPEIQKQRFLSRCKKTQNFTSSETFNAILSHQASREDRNQLADHLIRNNEDLTQLKSECLTLHRYYSTLFKK